MIISIIRNVNSNAFDSAMILFAFSPEKVDKSSTILRTLIVQLSFESKCPVVRTQTAFRRNTRNRNHPSPRCIRLIVAKFKALGTVANRQHPGRSRTARSIDNIESVRQDVTHNPQKSVRRRSEELQISKTSLRRILGEDLVLSVQNSACVEDWSKQFQEKASICTVSY